MAAYGHSVQFPGAGGAYGYSPAPPPQNYVEPGTLVFTRESDRLGRKEYHLFRAEPRTINGPNGPIDGMQWVPVDVLDRPPVDALPAGPDFHAAWGRQIDEREHRKAVKEWEREQEKIAKEEEKARREWERDHERLARQEEKEAAKRMKAWEKERRARERAELEEDEFRGFRRTSDVGWGNDLENPYPQASGFHRGRSRSRGRNDSMGQDELARKIAAVTLETRARSKSRSRRTSFVEPAMPIGQGEYTRSRKLSAAGYAQGVRGTSPARSVSFSNRPSPRVSGGNLPGSYGGNAAFFSRGDRGDEYDDYLARGSALQLGNVSGSYRSHSPIRGGSSTSFRAPSPRPRRGSMSAGARSDIVPDAFSRPPSHAVSYTPFDSFAILRDLNLLFEQLPPLPAILLPHDVYHEEWDECLNVIRSAWFNKGIEVKKRDKLLTRIIELWNSRFFAPRGVELVLLKGSQHRSGREYGRFDPELTGYGNEYGSEDDDTLSSISTDSDWGEESFGYYSSSRYGEDPYMMRSREAKRARKEAKKRKLKQKRYHEGRQDRTQPYSLYLTCLSPPQPQVMGRSPRAYVPSLI